MTSITQSIADLWGGKQILGRTIHSDNDLIPLPRNGLPYAALEHTMAPKAAQRRAAGALSHNSG